MRTKSGRQEMWNSSPPLRRSFHAITMASTAAMYARASEDESAEPATPIAGAPQWPNIRIQLPPALMRLALTIAKVTGFTMFMACRYRRNAA